MKAVVYTQFGPPEVLQLKEVEKPAPRDTEVLIRVHAASVNYGDLIARNFKNITARQFNMPLPLLLLSRMYLGVSKPKVNILGSEFAGAIESTGQQVTRFKVGDQVMGYLGQRMGAYAEYLCMPEDGLLALKPANLSYAEAAAVPYGAITATSLLRHAHIQPGDQVLINGASGSIGSAALQLARYYGAQVTGVCGTPRLEYVKSLGADRVIDYISSDFTQNGETYDLIFDVLGRSSFSRCKPSLKPDGVYQLASFKMKPLLQMLWTGMVGGRKVICALSSEKSEDLVFVKELIEAGQYKSIIDRSFPLEEATAAHRYVESDLKLGNVVITMHGSN